MNTLIATYSPITLEQMSGIRLMNRTDTKFVTTRSRLMQLLELARDQYMVQETGGHRVIPYYTTYFDTADFNMYVTHQNGHANRQKLRVRSYVASNLSFLEVKTKDNHKRTRKKRMEVDDDFMALAHRGDIGFRPGDDYCEFLHKHLRYSPQEVRQSLENNFNRITLVNRGMTERLTIDIDLRFHNLATGRDCDLSQLAIVELKRDGLMPSPILEMLLQLRIMPMGFSKYCMGSALTNPDLKTNRFKERLRLVEKFQHQESIHP